ncbi:MAG: IS3 family transposase ISBth8 [Desulfovibrio sp.]
MGSAQKIYFQIVDELRCTHPLRLLLHHSGLSKSGYYKWKNRSGCSSKNDELIEHILAIHSIRPYYGYRRMAIALKREGLKVNHKRVYRLMRISGIQSVIRKKRRYFGRSGSIVFPDLLGRNFSAFFPGRKLATDITYLPTTEGFLYLSAVQDLCNNEIVAYAISSRNDLHLVFATLDKLSAIPGAVLHSDQGFQYTHKSYKERLGMLQLQGSHSRKGNCLDNACMESFFSHLKTEAFAKQKVRGKDETKLLIEEHIRFYNTERFQKRLGQLSPVEYREKLAA